VLTDLRVRDLGVIEDLTLRLGPGMTALTGETGAGKTLLVEALSLVLGGRATSGLVRAGAAEALVEARFELPGEDRELLLARSVPAEGRSRAWVDGRMAPLAALAESAGALVDLHGQHEHQSLLSPSAQRRTLDTFAGADTARLDEARRRQRELEASLARLGGDPSERARQIDVLRHQADEIDAAAIGDLGEEEQLAAEEERLADMTALRQAASNALAAVEGDEVAADGTALGALGLAVAALAGRAPLAAWEDRLRAAMAELDDVASDLRRVVETWEDDPERLAEVQSRRRQLSDLRRKYGPTLADVVRFGVDARRQLEALEQAEAGATELGAALDEARAAVVAAAAALREVRRRAAPTLAAEAGARLRGLAMPGARFEVEVADDGAGDGVRFLLGANVGEPLEPLARVASGGELARAMLALRLVTSDGPGTLVFDEVDAGVGGEAALALGRALHEVATTRQVLVVTHLAQVAAFADHQVAVGKRTRGGRTVTEVAALSGDDRVIELSRMLSGHPDSPTARAHAEELLERATRRERSATAGRRVD
jgi:DNA repair protein RecN (Recombination protein N)